MKKFSIAAMFSLLLFSYSNVNAQYIPDSNFAAAISNACPTCIDANHDLTVDAQTLTSLSILGGNVTDLTGLDGFAGLQTFVCYNQAISVLPALPPNLIKLILNSSWTLTTLPSL